VVAPKDPHVVDTQASEDHAPNELSAIKMGTMWRILSLCLCQHFFPLRLRQDFLIRSPVLL